MNEVVSKKTVRMWSTERPEEYNPEFITNPGFMTFYTSRLYSGTEKRIVAKVRETREKTAKNVWDNIKSCLIFIKNVERGDIENL